MPNLFGRPFWFIFVAICSELWFALTFQCWFGFETNIILIIGFQRSKKDKSRDKQRGKHKAESEDDGSIGGSRPELNDATQPTTTTTNEDYFIDSEGFTVRTKTAVNKEGDNFYSSSEDSDSDDEKEKKIFVKINPLKNGTHSASVDQLIASATALPLAPSTQTVSFSQSNFFL